MASRNLNPHRGIQWRMGTQLTEIEQRLDLRKKPPAPSVSTRTRASVRVGRPQTESATAR